MKNKQRQMRMLVKGLSEDGSFEGLLSPYNNVDQGGDTVEPGAFTKTLSENGNSVPMLWQHDARSPIGTLTLSDQADGLYCKGQLLLDLPDAQKAYSLLKSGVIKGLSIGYESIKAQVVNGVRRLKEIRLFEGSVVTFPMNQLALITSVKSKDDSEIDFNSSLNWMQLSDADSQFRSALYYALSDLPFSGLAREDIISTADTILQQFRDAYMTYLPNYLDMLADRYGMDTKSWADKRESKAGRRLSAATSSTLNDAHGHVKSAFDILASLLDDEAGETTSDSEVESKSKTEPDTIHSAAKILNTMRSLLR